MNIILWTLVYLFVGLIIGNIKWKIAHSNELTSKGRWLKNPFFWLFFPWRCFITVLDKSFSYSFINAGFSSGSVLKDFEELYVDAPDRNLNCYLILIIIFWGIELPWNLLSCLILVPILALLYLACKWIIFPVVMMSIVKPLYYLYKGITYKLFQNHQSVIIESDE